MKRRRRVEIHIERREVSIFFGPPPGTQAAGPGTTPESDPGIQPGSPSQIKPEACPRCGAREMLPLGDPASLDAQNPAAFKQGVEAGRIHLHCSPSGEWWICAQSLHPA